MGMPEIRRQREHMSTDMLASAGTGLQRAGSKPMTKIVNAWSSGAVRQSSPLQELPEEARDEARRERPSG
jgi:hypothetical protein